jgi:ribosomal-protein-alanine N-acetyltransferase
MLTDWPLHVMRYALRTMNNLHNLFPIETERLFLRLPASDEAELMVQYYQENKEHLAPWEPIRSKEFYTERFWEHVIEDSKRDFLNAQGMRLVLFLKSSPKGPVIGVCNFSNIVRGVFQACHLGYSIDYRYQGQGYMYEALRNAIEFVFVHLKLHRIMANYIPRNERSGKLLRKLGFTHEGYARDYLKIAGKWEDHILTSLVRPEE